MHDYENKMYDMEKIFALYHIFFEQKHGYSNFIGEGYGENS